MLDLLVEVGLIDCKPADTPIIQNHGLGVYSDQAPTDKGIYQKMVERLIYLSHTQHDIVYVVSIVS